MGILYYYRDCAEGMDPLYVIISINQKDLIEENYYPNTWSRKDSEECDISLLLKQFEKRFGFIPDYGESGELKCQRQK